MFEWIKNMFAEAPKKSENPAPLAKQTENICKDIDSIILSEEIQTYLDNNGPEEAMRWLLEDLVENISGSQSADIFSGYYNNHYSKRDILDKYDDIISIDEAMLKAIAKLGSSYDDKYIAEAYSRSSFHIISQKTLADIAGLIAKNTISSKEIDNRLYSEYFSFVKDSLRLAQKVKASMGNSTMEEETVDEIEATLRKLLEAEQNSNSVKTNKKEQILEKCLGNKCGV